MGKTVNRALEPTQAIDLASPQVALDIKHRVRKLRQAAARRAMSNVHARTLPRANGVFSSHTRAAWWALTLYFGAHVLSRWLVSPALELDEAEQALWSQDLHWGYGAQPPLYTWLQWGVFHVLGVSVVSLSLLKNALLASTYVFVYLAGRNLMPANLASIGAASMLLLPQIGWEASRDLTHSVLLVAMCAATLALTMELLRRPRPVLYIATGLAVGFGALSKYSYVAFALVLLVALLTGRDTRAVLLSRWSVAGAAVAAIVVLPHALWLLQNWELATEATADKLGGTVPMRWGEGLLRGLGSLAVALLAFAGPWVLAMGLMFKRSATQRPEQPTASPLDARAFWRRYGIALGLLFLGMLVFGEVTRFKDRWMMPFLFLLPLAFFSCAPHLARHQALPALRRLLAVVAVGVLALLTARVPYHAWRDRPDELNQPVRELAQVVRAHGFAGAGAIVTPDRTLAGSLRVQFPKARVEVGDGLAGLPSSRPLLLVEPMPTTHQRGHSVALRHRFAPAHTTPARYRFRLMP